MPRSTRSVTILSFIASAIVHAGALFGLAYMVSVPSQERARVEVAPGEASAGIRWVEDWKVDTPVELAKVKVTPPPVEPIEPLIDRPERQVIPEHASLGGLENPEIDATLEVKPEPAKEPTPPEIVETHQEEVSPTKKPQETEPASPPPDNPGSRGEATIAGKLAPTYPRTCRRRGHEGKVIVECVIDERGVVTGSRIVKSAGCDKLDQAAVSAIRKARFHPATENGKSVGATVRIPIEFQLERN